MYRPISQTLAVLAVLMHVIFGMWLGGGAVLCTGDGEPASVGADVASACSHAHDRLPVPLPVPAHDHDCGCVDLPLGQMEARAETIASAKDTLRWVTACAPVVYPAQGPAAVPPRSAVEIPVPTGPPVGLRTARLLL